MKNHTNNSPSVPVGGAEQEPSRHDAIQSLQRNASIAVASAKPFTFDKNGQRKSIDQQKAIELLLHGELHASTIGGIPAVWTGLNYLFGVPALKYAIECCFPESNDRTNNGLLKKLLTRLEFENRYPLPPAEMVRFNNGVLNVRTLEFRTDREITWRDRIPNQIERDYDPSAPKIQYVDDFLDGLSDGDANIRQSLLEVLGLSLTRISEQQQAAILIGDGGNGKSVFMKLVSAIVGKQNVSNLSISRMANRFEIGNLAGKTLNVSSDLSAAYLDADKASVWKMAVGEDTLCTDVKGLQGYEFRPYCLLVMVCNEWPRTEGGIDAAIERRMQIIPFNHVYRDKNGLRQDADTHVVEKMLAPDCVAYLMRLAMDATSQMLQRHDVAFTTNAQAQEILHGIVVENSSVLQWLDELGLSVDSAREALHMQQRMTLYSWYKQWCTDSNTKALKQATFNREVAERIGLEKSTERVDVITLADEATTMITQTKKQLSVFVDHERKIADKRAGRKYASVQYEDEKIRSKAKNASFSSSTQHYNVEFVDLGTFEVGDSKAVQATKDGEYELDLSICFALREQFNTSIPTGLE